MSGTLQEQADSLAEFLGGVTASALTDLLPGLFDGNTTLERTDVTAFTITTRSGTVIECRFTPLAVGT